MPQPEQQRDSCGITIKQLRDQFWYGTQERPGFASRRTNWLLGVAILCTRRGREPSGYRTADHREWPAVRPWALLVERYFST